MTRRPSSEEKTSYYQDATQLEKSILNQNTCINLSQYHEKGFHFVVSVLISSSSGMSSFSSTRLNS